MNAAGVFVDVILERIRIGRLQLGQLSPVQNTTRQVMFRRKVFQHICARGIGPRLALFAALKPHLVEQDFAKLFRRADVEFAPREFVNFILKPCHLLRKGIRHAAKCIAVHLDARPFHRGQDRNKWTFKGFIHSGHLNAVQLWLEQLPQTQGDIGVFGGIGHSLFQRHLVKGDC